jgi:hypothetical protein
VGSQVQPSVTANGAHGFASAHDRVWRVWMLGKVRLVLLDGQKDIFNVSLIT